MKSNTMLVIGVGALGAFGLYMWYKREPSVSTHTTTGGGGGISSEAAGTAAIIKASTPLGGKVLDFFADLFSSETPEKIDQQTGAGSSAFGVGRA